MKRITKIVLTGGPCAGKSSSMKWIRNVYTDRGYKVIIVPETATELISNGVAPWTCGTPFEYQCCQMRLQLEKEAVFMEAAKTMPEDDVIIVCDRGMLDNLGYMSEDEFKSALKILNREEKDMCDRYDAVFFLKSAANGLPHIYNKNKEGNAARIESAEQAVELDNRLISAWSRHPYLRVIESSIGFEKKMQSLIMEITEFLEKR